MAFCSKCGAQMSGSFCGQCGEGAGPAASSAGTGSSAAALTDNAAAALCYLFGFVTGVVFLIWEPYNKSKNVRFHAYQSIFLSAAWMVIYFAVAVIMPWSLMFTLGPILQFAGFVLWLFVIYKTYKNERIVLPVIGDIAEKQS